MPRYPHNCSDMDNDKRSIDVDYDLVRIYNEKWLKYYIYHQHIQGNVCPQKYERQNMNPDNSLGVRYIQKYHDVPKEAHIYV